MLGDTDAFATIAVKNLAVARKFYEDKLGLMAAGPDRQPGVVAYTSGRSRVLVYESEFAGTNNATAATWIVGDQVEAITRSLRAKGVAFEHYDFPGLILQGDVHVGNNQKMAWCKDPDGNILAFVSG